MSECVTITIDRLDIGFRVVFKTSSHTYALVNTDIGFHPVNLCAFNGIDCSLIKHNTKFEIDVGRKIWNTLVKYDYKLEYTKDLLDETEPKKMSLDDISIISEVVGEYMANEMLKR